MAQEITAVQQTQISHAIFIDLNLAGNVFHISSAYAPITIGNVTYTELGAFLQVSEMSDDIKTTNGDIMVSVSGIPSEASYMDIVLSYPIKGGSINIKRGFFNPETLEPLEGQVFNRYSGVITNYAVDETTNFLNGELANQISISCASLNTVLENKMAGQRTNTTDRQKFYPDDISFNRVAALQNTQFDFGKKYSGGSGYTGGGGRPGMNIPNINFL